MLDKAAAAVDPEAFFVAESLGRKVVFGEVIGERGLVETVGRVLVDWEDIGLLEGGGTRESAGEGLVRGDDFTEIVFV